MVMEVGAQMSGLCASVHHRFLLTGTHYVTYNQITSFFWLSFFWASVLCRLCLPSFLVWISRQFCSCSCSPTANIFVFLFFFLVIQICNSVNGFRWVQYFLKIQMGTILPDDMYVFLISDPYSKIYN